MKKFTLLLLLATSSAFAYYDNTQGRFISRDPIGYADGMNLYQYVQARPMSLLDPLGTYALPATEITKHEKPNILKGVTCPGSMNSVGDKIEYLGKVTLAEAWVDASISDNVFTLAQIEGMIGKPLTPWQKEVWPKYIGAGIKVTFEGRPNKCCCPKGRYIWRQISHTGIDHPDGPNHPINEGGSPTFIDSPGGSYSGMADPKGSFTTRLLCEENEIEIFKFTWSYDSKYRMSTDNSGVHLHYTVNLNVDGF